MKITIIQQDIVWKEPQANIQKANKAINRNPGADIYILPEMFTTGFVTEPKNCAEPCDSESLHWMIRKSAEVNAAIGGSIAVEEEGKYYNRFYFVTPDGNVVQYDKSHLFIHGGEGLRYTAGNKRIITEFRGVKILLEICYDLRFPMWSRNQMDQAGNAAYDLIIYVADWPLSRKLAWDTLIRARAIENQCFVVACNRVGSDNWGTYFGGSALVHPYGHLIAEAPQDKECEITGEIDMEGLNRYRLKFPTLKDIIWRKDFC
ncbi:MAG: amidohydrolase [Bacteroidaceae bacterium]|nr:amidohydrolase [Bacteroidaceae bacterium]